VKYGNTAEVIIEQLESSDMLVIAYHSRNLLAEALPSQLYQKGAETKQKICFA